MVIKYSGTKLTPHTFTKRWSTSNLLNPRQSFVEHREWLTKKDWSRLSNRALLRTANPFDQPITLAYAVDDYSFTCRPGYLSYYGQDGQTFFKTSGQFYSQPPVSTDYPSTDSVRAKAYGSLVDQLYEAQTGSFDALLFAAEAGKTKQLISEKASSVSNAYDAFARDNRAMHKNARKLMQSVRSDMRATGRRILKRLAGRYLEFTYGVLPLLSDIDNAAKDLANMGLTTRQRVKRFTGSASEQYTTERLYLGISGMNNTYWFVYGDSLYESSAHFHGAFRFSVDIDESGKAASIVLPQRSRTLLEFVPTIYELIPYSFLLDYFLDVDKLIKSAALDTRNTVVYSGSWKASHTRRYHGQDATAYMHGGPGKINSSYGVLGDVVSTSKATRFIRDDGSYSAWQMVMSATIPSPKQWTNILALAINRFS